jgi:hypothetical protein
MTRRAKDADQPWEFVQLGESEYYVKLDGGEVDTANYPARLPKRARAYLAPPKRSIRTGKRKSSNTNERGNSK